MNFRPLLRLCAALLLATAQSAFAWSAHTLITWQALEGMPEVTRAKVQVERLEAFVAAEGANLERLLQEQEQWARGNVPSYPARPDALAFKFAAADGADPAALRARFLQALRLNPESRMALFIEVRPGQATPGKPRLPQVDVNALRRGTTPRESNYVALSEGEEVSALDVVASASHEPDFGLDIGLWQNNNTAHGARFAFGAQPFGNPKLNYGTQAPFHMGFYHESPIIFAAAGFLKRTLPEYRIQLFQALASHAFRSGHPYWGWRFTGWALHYVQDLTQPYHARVLPGVGTLRMLWINAIAMAGFEGAKNDAITLVSNRHTVLENYQLNRMLQAYENRDMNDPLLRALRDGSRDSEHRVYAATSTRQVVSAEAAAAADALDAVLEKAYASEYTSDPSRSLSAGDPINLYQVALKTPAQHAALEKVVANLLGNTGKHTRALVRAVLAAK